MQHDLHSLLNRIEQGHTPVKKEIERLLNLTDPEDVEQLFQSASRVREQYFGNRIFFYGFLYFSTFCRNDCHFCQYRRSNREQPRYRKTQQEILDAAEIMAASGVHLIDLTMGEDPVWHNKGVDGIRELTEVAVKVQQRTGLPVMVSPGMLPASGVRYMAGQGIEWYACYQETHNRELFSRLRSDQDYDARWTAKTAARDAGLLIEEGILTGVGESSTDLADSILAMAELGVDQARVMTFVPQSGTPMGDLTPQGPFRELVVIAVMRLVLRDCLIPASLDVDGLDGLLPRLAAGANVVTSIVPPSHGLAGVANPSLDIEISRRSLDRILPLLTSSNLAPASVEEYRKWVENRM